MKKLIVACAIIISFTLLILNFWGFVISKDNAFADNRRVAICHYPPDDSTNPQTLYLTEKAVQAHLKHGDVLGECPSGCLLNSSLCDDGNLCTSDTCLPNGDCENTPVSCDDGNPCTLDSCDAATGCLNVANDGALCDDGNACTDGDICVSTVCTGEAVPGCCTIDSNCDDGDPCTVDSCIGGTCTNAPKNCAVEDKCAVGYCEPSTGDCMTTPVTCNDGNVCTDDYCNSSVGCYSVPTSNPPQEICGDGIDNDCDGQIDEGITTAPLACDFSVSVGMKYYASYADYLARILSVDYTLQNLEADCTLNNVIASSTLNSNGVISENTPLSIGTFTGVGWMGFTIKYYVPAGVSTFSNSLVIIDGSGGQETLCGENITVPPPPA
jgi:hypothetical protein